MPLESLNLSIVDANPLEKEAVTIRVEFPPPILVKCRYPEYDVIYQRIDRLGYTPKALSPRPKKSVLVVSAFPHWIELAFNGSITCNGLVETFYGTIFTGKGSKLHGFNLSPRVTKVEQATADS